MRRLAFLLSAAVAAYLAAGVAGRDTGSAAPGRQLAKQPPAAAAACPVRGARLSSPYGPRWGKFHDGVDLAAPAGTPIRAVTAGVVTRSGPAGGYGQVVNVRAGDGSTAQYGHMRARLVAAGDQVGAGQPIALVGSEGEATGPHLHLRIYPRGVPVDPTHRGTNPATWLARRGVRLPC